MLAVEQQVSWNLISQFLAKIAKINSAKISYVKISSRKISSLKVLMEQSSLQKKTDQLDTSDKLVILEKNFQRMW